jgi:formylglycine-generating enzyme required for sulfatase activity
MRARLVWTPLILATLAMGAGAACFPGFAVTSGQGDGGASSGGASSGGASSGGASSGGASSGGTSSGGASSGAASSGGTSSGGTSSGAASSGGTSSGTASSGGASSGGFADGGGGYVPPGTFTYVFSSGDPSVTETFSHGFVMDVSEVTVAGFTNWVNAGKPLPNDGQSLDPGGPYASQMYWQAAWDTNADAEDFKAVTGTCTQAQDLVSLGEVISLLAPTYGTTPTTVPINCVNWYQAVAYCAYVGKRLPTQAEWQYEAVGRSHGYTYPWGDAPTPTDCSYAIWAGDGGTSGYDGCGFPLPVGSAPKGASIDGVQDLEGSVMEWIWDAFSFSDMPSSTDYAGPPEDAGSPDGREVRGGSWISPVSSLQSIEPANEGQTGVFTNLGFRCVKTVP